ncbi:MAG: arginine transport system substrate-binding protein [Candidatus Dependentiae bacterium]|nr:arginine transport system substrate-binding protein [Candidatus Dependentiae bacterium]
MNFLTALLASATQPQGDMTQLLLFGAVAVVLLVGVVLVYRFWQHRKATVASFAPARQVLSIGVVTSLINDAISPEIGAAFDGFMRETLDILASRMGSTARVQMIEPAQVEQALVDGTLDFVIVDGNIALTFSSKIELMPCYVSSLSALALVFWDKVPHHMMTLQDFAYYPANGTAVLKNSLEEHYLSMFETIKVRRVDTLTRLVVDLKLGLVRAGLVRMEQAKALKHDYSAIKFMPVSLQKQCFIQDEKIAASRANKALIKELEYRTTLLRREGIMKKIHGKWFAGLRPRLPKALEPSSVEGGSVGQINQMSDRNSGNSPEQ